MTYFLMFDVGGTKIKAGIFTDTGNLSDGRIRSFDSKANRPKDEIFRNFADIINSLIEQIRDSKKQIAGIGMAFPGPFDYENGVSKMTGLNKYDAIYGCDFKKELMEELKKTKAVKWMKKEPDFTFIHDVEAFATGESHYGAGACRRRVMYLCIGTGAGSSFTKEGKVLKSEADNVPENGWIYNTPFKDSVIDDYISSRGLRKISGKYLEEPADGAILYEMALRKEQGALQAFHEFGSWLAEAIAPFLQAFSPDCLVLGGQISKSYDFFGKQLDRCCKERGIAVELTEDTSLSILKGLFVQMRI